MAMKQKQTKLQTVQVKIPLPTGRPPGSTRQAQVALALGRAKEARHSPPPRGRAPASVPVDKGGTATPRTESGRSWRGSPVPPAARAGGLGEESVPRPKPAAAASRRRGTAGGPGPPGPERSPPPDALSRGSRAQARRAEPQRHRPPLPAQGGRSPRAPPPGLTSPAGGAGAVGRRRASSAAAAVFRKIRHFHPVTTAPSGPPPPHLPPPQHPAAPPRHRPPPPTPPTVPPPNPGRFRTGEERGGGASRTHPRSEGEPGRRPAAAAGAAGRREQRLRDPPSRHPRRRRSDWRGCPRKPGEVGGAAREPAPPQGAHPVGPGLRLPGGGRLSALRRSLPASGAVPAPPSSL
ncbi:basic proline-rich protein-like [Falco peregrinus]|uniref:basic proline-rich protein-like n=1 Tax=Falco peregrinus TaxID=8954 RepID=UPI0024797F91|nr:basic proline-rich protein-like [Falco peregrinus]